jgi:hypothetical protein
MLGFHKEVSLNMASVNFEKKILLLLMARANKLECLSRTSIFILV